MYLMIKSVIPVDFLCLFLILAENISDICELSVCAKSQLVSKWLQKKSETYFCYNF